MKISLVTIVIVLAAGCGAARGPAPRASARDEGPLCPAGLPGLQAQVTDLDGGGALALEVAPTSRDELRARVQRFARVAQYERPEVAAPEAWIHQSTLRTDNTPDGIVLEARAENEGRARELRAELQTIAEDLEAGRCPLALERAD